MLPQLNYPVTERARDALRRGLRRCGKSQTQIADAIGVSRQAINNILQGRTERSEHLADLLREVGEPEYLALPLTELQLMAIELVERLSAVLTGDQVRQLLDDFRRSADGAIAVERIRRMDDFPKK